VSAIGIVVAGLDARRTAGAEPLTFVCCDNLPHNGQMVEGLVLAFARRRDPALARWIADHVTFPATMVDRIVPATTDADFAEADRQLGVHDAAPVPPSASGNGSSRTALRVSARSGKTPVRNSSPTSRPSS
jgi:fructuronate reductase